MLQRSVRRYGYRNGLTICTPSTLRLSPMSLEYPRGSRGVEFGSLDAGSPVGFFVQCNCDVLYGLTVWSASSYHLSLIATHSSRPITLSDICRSEVSLRMAGLILGSGPRTAITEVE